MKAIMIGAGMLAATTALAAASPAAAQANVMKDCAAKYQAAKTAKTLPAGQTWMQYLAQCRGTMAKPAVATAAKPATVAATATKATAARTVATSAVAKTNAPVAAKPAGQRSAAQVAEVSRQKQCGTMWKADKAAGKTGSQTWPQYWSACSKRLKG